MVQLDSRPAGTVSARATPRTTPSRTLRSLSPINSSLPKFPHFQIFPLLKKKHLTLYRATGIESGDGNGVPATAAGAGAQSAAQILLCSAQ